MYSLLLLSSLLAPVFATRPFLNEPDTGFDPFVPEEFGTLPPLDDIHGLTDFDAAARNYMNASAYAYYRNGAAGEWSYRNNLEVFGRMTLRPRVMIDITNVNNTLATTILGYNYSVPFFITSAARAGYGNPEGEKTIMRAAEAENILYVPSSLSTIPLEEIVGVKSNGASSSFATMQQLYITNNDTETQGLFQRIEAAGQRAIFLTVDSPADGVRQRAERYGQGSADDELILLTWERYNRLQKLTSLPLIPKGIQTVDDALLAIEHGAPAIYLSNHGGRQLDTSPSPFEVALEIYRDAPEVFDQIEVYADGGVRYGTDVIKMLALGVKAVGIARPFMFANCYGEEGVRRAVQLMRSEVLNDAGNMGIADVQNIDARILNLNNYGVQNGWFSKRR